VYDVRKTLIGKLSKGYKQRVGLAQAIIHNPDVLILDEPTAGLDPHQIIETRDLIKDLAARQEHTIILSTHILPEVEQTCERVIIISKGKLVALDTVANLTSRLRGAETVDVEVLASDAAAVQRSLEQVAGVSRVIAKEHRDGKFNFMVESLEGRQIRPGLAKAVVDAGWQLNELHAVGLSLEEIFLQLTASPDQEKEAAAPVEPVAAGESQQ
jgi:ABC-2 type transport system ATP-binding protein